MKDLEGIEGGGARNDRESSQRLDEMEDDHLRRKDVLEKKQETAKRRRSLSLVKRKKDLAQLSVTPELYDQCYLRDMSRFEKGWQKMTKNALVALCVKHKTRLKFESGDAASDTDTQSEAWADEIEPLTTDNDDDDDDDDDNAAPATLSGAKRGFAKMSKKR